MGSEMCIRDRWAEILELLTKAEFCALDRYYFKYVDLADLSNVYLHGFSDASKDAYAAVIYVVGEVDGKFISNFVSCKTKVAPLKKVHEKETSIPRLELCGCLLLCRLVQTVQDSLKDVLKIDRLVCWCDSLDALFWIKRQNKSRDVFVENRKKKVVKIVPPESWRHVDGDKNPADLPSRGVYPSPRIEQVLKQFIDGPDVIRSPGGNGLRIKAATMG